MQKTFTSAWVGMDGHGSGVMEQIGTLHYCVSGYPMYGSFYQMYPAPAVFPRLVIRPGDLMEGEVRHVSGHMFRVSLRNLTTGGSYTIQASQPSAMRQSAAWVVEDVSYDGTLKMLTTMSPVSFSRAAVTVNGAVGGIRDLRWGNVMLTMLNPSGERLVAPSLLQTDLRSFTIGRVSEESVTRA